MHRSGTSMLINLLKNLGLFTGVAEEPHLEATFFLRRNDWLMRMAGGSWDYPRPLKSLLKMDKFRIEAETLFRDSVASRQFVEFTGSLTALLINSRSNLRHPWGWKDPRTVFTVRLWLRIFPDARILYLIRNGVDVAKSLLIREKEFIDINVRGLHTNSLTHRLWGALHPLQRFPYTSARCVSLEEGFRLWEEYTYESEEFYNGFNGQKMHIRYEDLLNDPYRSITETAAFCGLEPSEKDIREQVSDLRTGRSFAFTNEEDLLDFYGKIKNTDLMKTLKYDEIL